MCSENDVRTTSSQDENLSDLVNEELLIKFNTARVNNDTEKMRLMIQEEPALVFYGCDIFPFSSESDTTISENSEVYLKVKEATQSTYAKHLETRDAEMKIIKQGFVSYFMADGKKASELSKELNLGKMAINKLNDRLVEARTIPATLILRLAEVLGASQRAIQAYFQQPPLQTHAMYRSSDHPDTVSSLEAFSDVIQNDPTTRPEDKDFWLNAS